MRALSLTITLLAAAARAQDAAPGAEAPVLLDPPPSADEIKRVYDYQENGKLRGPALLDLVPCLKVDQVKGSPTAFTCVEPITGPVKKGTIVHAWMQWFCPKGGKYEDITLQWMFDGQPRSTVDLVVEGLSRTRTWRAQSLTKAGTWQIRIMRGGKELGLASITVEP
ncbi:MAG: DUF2914 domain-containing protein [Archangium sp.]|nr:DUF2914 domain-containing protein [Archangium sp.]